MEGVRPLFSVYKDHIVPLAVPVPQIRLAQVVYVEDTSDVVPSAPNMA